MFCYCYTVCKKFLQRVFANNTLVSFLATLAGYLISTLVRVKFYDWLVEQGGWVSSVPLFTPVSHPPPPPPPPQRQMVASMMPRVPAWGNNLLLVGGVVLGAMWVYKTFFGGK